MKIYKIALFMVCGFSVAAYAVDSFYYGCFGKVTLHEDPTRVVMLSPKSASSKGISKIQGLHEVKKLDDPYSDVRIYGKDAASDLWSLRRSVSVSSSMADMLPCYKDGNGLELAPSGYIYVKLKREEDFDLLERTASEYGCTVVRQDRFMPLWYTLHVPSGNGLNPIDIANSIYETGRFESSSPEFSYDPLEISYDPKVHEQWGLYNAQNEKIDISVSQAWNYSTGKGVKIAIIDQGIELTHEDLAENIYPLSYDAYEGKSPSKVYNTHSIGHGTHCAGIAAAVRNNGIGIAGVAPDASLMSVSLNFNDTENSYQFAEAINWAWHNGADILSCSWNCPDEPYIRNALEKAISRGRNGLGCIVVKSAGNTGDTITFPGNLKNIIAVANVTRTGKIDSFSSHGPNMFIAAPGSDILSTMVGNTYAEKGGTSMACPHLSGVVALILERNPDLRHEEVREILGWTADKIGDKEYKSIKFYGTWNEYYGYGLVNAYKAVTQMRVK